MCAECETELEAVIGEETNASFLRDEYMKRITSKRRRRYRASSSDSSAGTGTKDVNEST
jgi:hypothetical protein